MSWLQALILGILQGLTEFLPVSSSGHIELSKALLQIDIREELSFTVVIHGATVCSTIVVFAGELKKLFNGSFALKWNDSNRYLAKLLVSFIPVLIAGLFLESYISSFFSGNLTFVGYMLLITATLLTLTYFARVKGKPEISFFDSFIIGIAQAFAVLPGISRSGATISTGLLLGNGKENVSKFSFLMVLVPIIGKNLLDIFSGEFSKGSVDTIPLLVGFIAAFFTGWLACKWMIELVKKSKLIWFALYCAVIGIITILLGT